MPEGQEPDLTYFTLHYGDTTCQRYDALVYCKFLARTIRITFCQPLDENGRVNSYPIYCTTDLHLPAFMIARYYQLRFQQAFLIRDAWQFCRLQDCQARSANKLEYHWNTALQAVNEEITTQLNRGFLWIQELVGEHEKYDSSRSQYRTLEEYMPNIAKAYGGYVKNLDTYKEKISKNDLR